MPNSAPSAKRWSLRALAVACIAALALTAQAAAEVTPEPPTPAPGEPTRTVSGTVHFYEGAPAELRDFVQFFVFYEGSGEGGDVTGHSYDPATGKYSAPVRAGKLNFDAAVYCPEGTTCPEAIKNVLGRGAQASSREGEWFVQNWDIPPAIDTTDGDVTDHDLYFTAPTASVFISMATNVGPAEWNAMSEPEPYEGGDAWIYATNTTTGDRVQLDPGMVAEDRAGKGVHSQALGTFLSGVPVQFTLETQGVTVYYDGTATGTLDATKATPITFADGDHFEAEWDVRDLVNEALGHTPTPSSSETATPTVTATPSESETPTVTTTPTEQPTNEADGSNNALRSVALWALPLSLVALVAIGLGIYFSRRKANDAA